MREIQASAAKTHFLQLLDDVERGETVAITRHGKRIAVLTPDEAHRQDQVRGALERLAQVQKRMEPVTLEEIIEWRNEGRK